jgi:hypothetical protein
MSRLFGMVESAISAARRGDKQAAQRAARYIAEDLAAGTPLSPMARQYLVDGLRQISEGVPGNEAFHTSGKKGRPVESNAARDLMIAAHVEALHQEGASIGDAVQAVVQYLDYERLNESAIEKIHRKHRAWLATVDVHSPVEILAEIRSLLPPKSRT